jgi:hypothetical protein
MDGIVEIARELVRKRFEQRLEIGEVIVEGTARDTRSCAHVLDPRRTTVLVAEEIECRIEQRSAGARASLGSDLGASFVIDAGGSALLAAWRRR